MNEYRTLEMQFQDVLKQGRERNKGNENQEETLEESDLVSLSLGRVPNNQRNDEKITVHKKLKDDEGFNQDLTLGLECKSKSGGSTTEALPNPSPENSSEVPKEEAGETWPPSKDTQKTIRDTEDEVAQQNPMKKPRVCVRARCDTPTVNLYSLTSFYLPSFVNSNMPIHHTLSFLHYPFLFYSYFTINKR